MRFVLSLTLLIWSKKKRKKGKAFMLIQIENHSISKSFELFAKQIYLIYLLNEALRKFINYKSGFRTER